MQFDNPGVARLKVVTEPELGTLARILELLQSANMVPLRMTAERVAIRGRTTQVLEIEIELPAAGTAPAALRLIAAKTNQIPGVLSVVTGE